MAKSHFWRASVAAINTSPTQPTATQTPKSSVLRRMKKGNFVLVGDVDELSGTAHVEWVGKIEEVLPGVGQIIVSWKKHHLTLTPEPAGRTNWLKREWFNFSPNVAERYGLSDTLKPLW